MVKQLMRGSGARLKSGGPFMVVFDILDDEAYCRWLEGRELRGELFNLDDIEVVDVESVHGT